MAPRSPARAHSTDDTPPLANPTRNPAFHTALRSPPTCPSVWNPAPDAPRSCPIPSTNIPEHPAFLYSSVQPSPAPPSSPARPPRLIPHPEDTDRLGLKSTAELVRYTVRDGLIQP